MRQIDVPVTSGTLRAAVWGGGNARPVVVAAHGITSSSRFWTLVGESLAPHVCLVAPDLRGRGDSADVGWPYGIEQHADDLIAVLDHMGVEAAVFVGHSMGGFVVTTSAVRHRDRVNRLILVDGGPPLTDELASDTDVDAVLQAIIGPSLDRLRTTFPSAQDYRGFWRSHPAFRDGRVPAPLADAYADHDLSGTPPVLRSKVSIEAVRSDARDTLVNDAVRTAIDRVTCPAVLLWAERGMLDEPQGLYSAKRAAAFTTGDPARRARCVPDTNHFTIGMSDHGAHVIADAVRDALAQEESR